MSIITVKQQKYYTWIQFLFFFWIVLVSFFVYQSCHWYFHFAGKLQNLWTDSFLAVQKFICLRANVETGVPLIPLNLYLFSSLLWNVPLALWSMYKEELFKSQLEEGQFKISHQHRWFPTNCQLIFLCLHLNSPMTDTDPPWIMSVLTKLLFQPTLATAQGYPEIFYSPSVKFRVFQYLIFKILDTPIATEMPSKSYKTCYSCVFTRHLCLSPDLQKNYYFCRWCLAISTYFITLLLHRVLSHLM